MAPEQVLARGRFLKLTLIDGYEMVERIGCTGVVVVLPVTGAGEVVLIDQHRPAVGRRCVELPAGLVGDRDAESRETRDTAAGREVRSSPQRNRAK